MGKHGDAVDWRDVWVYSKYNPPKDGDPVVCESLKQFEWENLVMLSIEEMSEYIQNVILPKMVSDYRKGRKKVVRMMMMKWF